MSDKTSAGALSNSYNVFNQNMQTTVGALAMSSNYADTTNDERITAGTTSYSNGVEGVDGQTTGAASTYFVHDPDGTLIAMHNATGSYYYALDAKGSVLGMTDGNQGVVASYHYDGPWGNQTSQGGTLAAANPWRYATGYMDAQTGYLKLGVRYYNQDTGRFSQPDPESTWGGFTYADDDPVNKVDPTGRAGTFSGCAGEGVLGCIYLSTDGENASIGLGLGVGAGEVADFTYDDSRTSTGLGSFGGYLGCFYVCIGATSDGSSASAGTGLSEGLGGAIFGGISYGFPLPGD